MRTVKLLGLLLFLFCTSITYAQTNSEKAESKVEEAIELMDSGQIDESIKLLKEAEKLDPSNFNVAYEMAYAYYLKKDWKTAIKILEKNKNHKDVSDVLYQLLGNAYDYTGNSKKAHNTYDEGLNKFPKSGKLYLEKGNVHWAKKDYGKALPYYEKGIEIDPAFSSNYYRAAILYLSSDEEVWGMLYGEIFMNLERNSQRTAEISKLLYDTYKSEIKFTSDTSYSVSFSKNATITADNLKDPENFKLPFGVGAYEFSLMMAITDEKAIDINSLDRIRTGFLQSYFRNGLDKKYPNALFDYQNQVLKAGHLEAYNHWILMKGDEAAFEKWQADNKQKWDDFVTWFSDNRLQLTATNKFFSGQY